MQIVLLHLELLLQAIATIILYADTSVEKQRYV
jgi:hypothetical protein